MIPREGGRRCRFSKKASSAFPRRIFAKCRSVSSYTCTFRKDLWRERKVRNVGKIHYSQKCKIFEKNALVLVYSYLLPKYCQIKITHKVFVAPNIKHLLLKCLDSFLC